MKKNHLVFALFFTLASAAPRAQTHNPLLKTQNSPNSEVNPFIGTGGHGHTFPGATMPFGMVQLSPDTRPDPSDWDGCSGYHFSDSLIYGFSHTHLSGTGVSDYCDILVQPVVRDANFSLGKTNASVFSKKTERAEPGFYEVFLEKPRVKVELTASERVGFHRYTFDKNAKNGSIFIDLNWRDVVLDANFDFSRKKEGIITGHRFSSSWAKDQRIFFFLKFSKTPENVELSSSERIAIFDFDLTNQSEIIVECAISSVDVAGAEANWLAETTNFDFEKAKIRAQNAWQKQLSKIEITGGTERERTIFYTALYHTMLAPNIFSDVDGRYRGRDQQIHQAQKGATMYTVFSLWDTYRALHPLMTILEPDRVRDWMYTFWRQSEEGGKLPVWELAANETNCMIGNHAIPVIADAYLKGLVADSLVVRLYEAAKKSATDGTRGLDLYDKFGYIPSDLEPESVSKTIEYSFDDYALSRMSSDIAIKIEHENREYKNNLTKVSNEWRASALRWQNIYNPATGHFQPKSNSTFVEPFDPTEVNFNFTEANSWQYGFIQHDFINQIAVIGGNYAMQSRLDSLFFNKKKMTGRVQADITGLLGNYAQGNEPSHHIPYLYNKIGQPWKCQQIIRQILNEMFNENPDGLPGNDDCGQMSAWVVWSMLGMYPTSPVLDGYDIGIPSFKSWKLSDGNGNITRFKVENFSKNGYYLPRKVNNNWLLRAQNPSKSIRDTRYKGNIYSPFVFFSDLLGKKIHINLTNPDKLDAYKKLNFPFLENTCGSPFDVPPVPFLKKSARVFTEPQQLEWKCLDPEAEIFYAINNGVFQKYEQPIFIEKNTEMRAFSQKNDQKSPETFAEFTHQPDRSKWKITQKTNFNNQYTGRGERGLMDGLRGGKDFRSGGFQGFEGQNMVATLDFGELKTVKKLSIGFLQDENSWIFLPKKVIFETSIDGENWSLAGEELPEHTPNESGIFLQDFSTIFSKKSVRFLRISAENLGKCPPTHKGAGYDSWIFSDEILVE